MNGKPDSNGPLRRRDHTEYYAGNPGTNGNSNPAFQSNGHSPSRAFDVWTALDILVHRWHWLVIGGIIGCGAFLVLGWKVIKPKYTATAQLLRYETPGMAESLKGPFLTPETFSSLITSPDLLRRVGSQVVPPIPPERFIKQMKVDPQPDSDVIKVFVAAREKQQAVELANLYTREAVAYTTELQARQAAELAATYLKAQVSELDRDIVALHEEFRALPMAGQMTSKLSQVSGDLQALNQSLANSPGTLQYISKLSEKLQTSLAELTELSSKYTDLHPAVQQKQQQIDSLKAQISNASKNPGTVLGSADVAAAMNLGPNGRPLDPNYDIIHAKLRSLEDARIQMATRQREAELFANNPPGMVRVFAPATLKTVESNHRRLKIGLVAIFGGLLGMGCGFGMVLITEIFDNRLRTVDDLKRVSRLPVLTTLGDLNEMEHSSRVQWAFRTWTMLQGRLSRSANHGLVCGITSSKEGEGRSTWISLLAEAASLSGFRVLTIATKPSSSLIESSGEVTEETLNNPAEMNTSSNTHETNDSSNNNHSAALTPNVLASPSQVTEQLTGPNSQPVVHIPLPGWVWNLDRRKQWRAALNQWRQIDNLVIFVELPPASVPEAVLLGSNLPNLIWLADSGTADAGETRTHLQTLRNARCNLVGAVLNRESLTPLKRLFPRWVSCFALMAALAASNGEVRAQDTNAGPPPAMPPAAELPTEPPPSEEPSLDAAAPIPSPAPLRTNLSFSVSPVERAPWQQRLTLGPGDVLSFALYGEPNLKREEVVVAPDGRVSFLEAQDVLATGLTVDELRAKIDEELGRYRRAPHTIITPVAYKSKKYYMLGKVVQRGVYILDRPITVLEALARARGIETGLVEQNTVELADLSRSFLMRGGKRIPLDFESLFQNGDLTQNIQIEPDDFLYFPSASIQQVFVLGEVALPGPVTYRPDTTLVTAISTRGGFNEKAYKSHVLVVRGSLNRPQTYAVNTMAILNGRAPDFKLEPKDIVYVSHRPFYRAEELLDLATTAFIQAVVTGWVGRDFITP